ncbi:hypothetical protein ILYODFUR_015673 [Ilyodon furcidens]|uniref:Uncharacterized protein n=1 Tax=Ilyodon furcidens TaxID=33524 RepID=A0ABV0TLI0_9TELE
MALTHEMLSGSTLLTVFQPETSNLSMVFCRLGECGGRGAERGAGEVLTVVCQSVLMLLDSLFPVLVRHWVCAGIRPVILAAVQSISCALLSLLLIKLNKIRQVLNWAKYEKAYVQNCLCIYALVMCVDAGKCDFLSRVKVFFLK